MRKEGVYSYKLPIEHDFNAAWESNRFRAKVSKELN
jgi:hypothetical protein